MLKYEGCADIRQMIQELLDRIHGYAKQFSHSIRERNELMKGIRTQIKVYIHQTQHIVNQYAILKLQRDELVTIHCSLGIQAKLCLSIN